MRTETVVDHNQQEIERIHPEQLESAESITHYPTSVKQVVMLNCSCGFSGLAAVDTDSDEPGTCPNCESSTVHPKHVKELATTDIKFQNGQTRTMVANKPVDDAPLAPVVGLDADQVTNIVREQMKPFTDTMQQLQAFLATQVPKQPVASVPVTESKPEGVTQNA